MQSHITGKSVSSSSRSGYKSAASRPPLRHMPHVPVGRPVHLPQDFSFQRLPGVARVLPAVADRNSRNNLNDLLSAEQPDRTAIDRKLEEIGAAQVALEKSAIGTFLNMRDALTPEQRQKIQQLMTQPQPPASESKAAPRGPQATRRGERAAAPAPNRQGQTQSSQQPK